VKSVRLHGTGDLQLHEEEIPVDGVEEKLIRVTSVGVCGSDLHWFSEGGIGDAKLDHALVLGHEMAGVTSDGQRVAIDPAIPCGSCEFCQHGHPNLCSNLIFAGHGKTDGAMREWMTWNAKSLFPIPDSLSDDDGAMLEPLGVAIHTVDLGKIRPGMSVGVFGCGPIGLLVLQMARLAGASNIIATDKLPHRIEAAKGLGASQVFDARDSDRLNQIRAAMSKQGVDVAFDASGAPDAVEDAFAAVAVGGKVILAGIPDEDKTSFTASVARRKGLTIKMVRRMKHTYPRAIELVSKGLVDVRSLVTHRFPLERSAEAFHVAQRREGLKVVIEVST
jgi:L-iditol 2-dehydrogenase